jgi:hypothetical protein
MVFWSWQWDALYVFFQEYVFLSPVLRGKFLCFLLLFLCFLCPLLGYVCSGDNDDLVSFFVVGTGHYPLDSQVLLPTVHPFIPLCLKPKLRSMQHSVFPVYLWIEVSKPGVSKDDVVHAKICDEEHLDLSFVTLSDSEFTVVGEHSHCIW